MSEIEPDSEIELAIEPDSEIELEQPKPSQKAVQPLPRMWKSEADSTEDEDPPTAGADRGAKKPSKSSDVTSSKSSSKPKPSAPTPKTTKPKKAKQNDLPAAGKNAEKKALVEETPAFDTYESRRRARILMGGLSATCVLLVCWIGYRTFLYDPSPVDIPVDEAAMGQGAPEPKPSLDREARFMFQRAQELHKNGHADQAIAMLEKLVTVYKDTPTAKEAKVALDRLEKNLPFSGPVVVAEPERAAPAPSSPPRAVVDAVPSDSQAAKGQAALVLPANPPEAVVVPPPGANTTDPNRAATASRPLPAGFQANPQAGVHSSGWPMMIMGDRDGAPMVFVPGDTFTMGNDEGQAAEKPAHSVRLSSYYIDQHEVTNRLFRVFLAETRHRGQPPGKWLTDEKARTEPDTLPVVYVNFNDADAYAKWAAKQLPTEAQWEMAARSADSRRFPWGDGPPKWSRPRTARQIDDVMSFPEDRSAYGVFDMAGNVQEWTKDWYDSKYFQQFANRTVDNPLGPTTRPRSKELPVVVKGGSKTWTLSYREGIPYDKRLAHVGFRCVLSVEGPTSATPSGGPAGQPTGAPPATAPNRSNAPPF